MRRHEEPQESQPATIPVEPAHAATSEGLDQDDTGDAMWAEFAGALIRGVLWILGLTFVGGIVGVTGKAMGMW